MLRTHCSLWGVGYSAVRREKDLQFELKGLLRLRLPVLERAIEEPLLGLLGHEAEAHQ